MKTMMKTRLLAVALVAFFGSAFAVPALANGEKNPVPVEMKYAGSLDDQPLLYMTFTGKEEREFIISIRDEYGNLLYREIVKGANFTKRFVLNTEEIGDAELKFEVSSKGYDKPAVFSINKQSRTVEDLVISKVN
jgi:hypothetical protein